MQLVASSYSIPIVTSDCACFCSPFTPAFSNSNYRRWRFLRRRNSLDCLRVLALFPIPIHPPFPLFPPDGHFPSSRALMFPHALLAVDVGFGHMAKSPDPGRRAPISLCGSRRPGSVGRISRTSKTTALGRAISLRTPYFLFGIWSPAVSVLVIARASFGHAFYAAYFCGLRRSTLRNMSLLRRGGPPFAKIRRRRVLSFMLVATARPVLR